MGDAATVLSLRDVHQNTDFQDIDDDGRPSRFISCEGRTGYKVTVWLT